MPASEMTFSRNVTAEGDHVVIWGMGRNKYAWIAISLAVLPFSNFSVEVEVSADTAANRWPNIAVAFNDSSNLQVEKRVLSVDWHWLTLGQFTPDKNDSSIYFVFTNDFYKRKKKQDLNLRIRTVRFKKIVQEYFTIPAAQMQFSKNVSVENDHVVVWGLGKKKNAWIACPISSVPYSSFLIEAEVSADTAANRWPNIGLAVNGPRNLLEEKQVTSLKWQVLSLAQMTPNKSDTLLYFVFTNDYSNPKKNQDLNLKVRKVIFHEIKNDFKTVRVSWNPNTEPDLAGYRIHYGLSSGNYTHHIDVGLVTEKEISLSVQSTYYIAITAYGPTLFEESPPSDEVEFKFPNSAQQSQARENDEFNKQDVSAQALTLPAKYSLSQNYPNPFNQGSVIRYELPFEALTKLEIFNLLGQKVRSLISREQQAGIYYQKWDGLNEAGQPVPSGIYLYCLKTKNFEQTKRMIVVR
ncbi:MAG: T9SS type A sorting domain-containing protein [bacterium]